MLKAVNNEIPLRPEDRLAIELLVDGELEDEARRELLIRLDSIRGGWRVCAITFLESQCLRETYRGRRRSDRESARLGMSEQKPWTRQQELEGQKRLLRDLFPNSGLLNSGRMNLGESHTDRDLPDLSQEIDASIDGTAALQTAPVATTKPDPVVIPLKRGGYRSSLSGNHSSDGSSGGPTRPTVLMSMAAGFLIAFVLGSLVWGLFLISPSSSSVSGPSLTGAVPVAVNTPIENQRPTIPAVEATIPELPPLAGEGIANIVADQSVNNSTKGNVPVHRVTLKSSSPDMNGVSVPCVEADHYDPKSLRTLRDQTSNAVVEDLRKQGHDVETVYEDFMFPMEDGRTLILPVDTYRVRSPIRYQ